PFSLNDKPPGAAVGEIHLDLIPGTQVVERPEDRRAPNRVNVTGDHSSPRIAGNRAVTVPSHVLEGPRSTHDFIGFQSDDLDRRVDPDARDSHADRYLKRSIASGLWTGLHRWSRGTPEHRPRSGSGALHPFSTSRGGRGSSSDRRHDWRPVISIARWRRMSFWQLRRPLLQVRNLTRRHQNHGDEYQD